MSGSQPCKLNFRCDRGLTMMPQSNSKYYCEIHGCNPTHMTLENMVPNVRGCNNLDYLIRRASSKYHRPQPPLQPYHQPYSPPPRDNWRGRRDCEILGEIMASIETEIMEGTMTMMTIEIGPENYHH